ncbi:MAG: hypothetical protein ACOY4D_07880 [Pseudomonadota bacterium]
MKISHALFSLITAVFLLSACNDNGGASQNQSDSFTRQVSQLAGTPLDSGESAETDQIKPTALERAEPLDL